MIKQFLGSDQSKSGNDLYHGDETFIPVLRTEKEYEEDQIQEREKWVTKALDYITAHKDEFVALQESMLYVKDEFGLTDKEMETVIHRWILK